MGQPIKAYLKHPKTISAYVKIFQPKLQCLSPSQLILQYLDLSQPISAYLSLYQPISAYSHPITAYLSQF